MRRYWAAFLLGFAPLGLTTPRICRTNHANRRHSSKAHLRFPNARSIRPSANQQPPAPERPPNALHLLHAVVGVMGSPGPPADRRRGVRNGNSGNSRPSRLFAAVLALIAFAVTCVAPAQTVPGAG